MLQQERLKEEKVKDEVERNRLKEAEKRKQKEDECEVSTAAVVSSTPFTSPPLANKRRRVEENYRSSLGKSGVSAISTSSTISDDYRSVFISYIKLN